MKKLMSLVIASIALAGCGGGGGGGLASLIGGTIGSLAGGGGTTSTVGSGLLDGGSTIATIHNPEPTTLILLGSGLLAMAAYNRAKK